MKQMAEKYGVRFGLFYYRLKTLGWPIEDALNPLLRCREKEKRKCENCKISYVPTNNMQKFCGSRREKVGCSYTRFVAKEAAHRSRLISRGYYKNEKWRAYQREHKKAGRRNATAYAERQRKVSREWAVKNADHAKAKRKEWRRSHMQLVLEKNRARVLRKRGVGGAHTSEDWERLQWGYEYCCVVCGTHTAELAKKWQNVHSGFCKLTKDHIIPIKHHGTDDISNLQPLCVSCNARKNDKIQESR